MSDEPRDDGRRDGEEDQVPKCVSMLISWRKLALYLSSLVRCDMDGEMRKYSTRKRDRVHDRQARQGSCRGDMRLAATRIRMQEKEGG